jgi:hypothetical protein
MLLFCFHVSIAFVFVLGGGDCLIGFGCCFYILDDPLRHWRKGEL